MKLTREECDDIRRMYADKTRNIQTGNLAHLFRVSSATILKVIAGKYKPSEEYKMANQELNHKPLSWEDFAGSVPTGIPGLYAVLSHGEILVARRGGAWYTPRGVEAEKASSALAAWAEDNPNPGAMTDEEKTETAEHIVKSPFDTMQWGDGQAKPLETIDITPVGMTTPEGIQRVRNAQQEWDSATHLLANTLKELMEDFAPDIRSAVNSSRAYGEAFHQLTALVGARDRKQEAFLRAVAGR